MHDLNDTQRQNRLIADSTQALLGNITPHMICLSVDITDDSAVIHCLMDCDDSPSRDALDDSSFELTALQWPDGVKSVSYIIHIGEDAIDWRDLPGRKIYLRYDADR